MKKFYVISCFIAAAAGSSYASTISWAANMFPATISDNATDLGSTFKNFLDDTNTYLLPVTSINITDLPATTTVGTTFAPTFGVAGDLAYKNNGPATTEWGVGVMTPGETDGEIRLDYGVQLNLSAFAGGSATFTITSLDSGDEGYRVWGSTTPGGQMTLLADGHYPPFSTNVTFSTSTFQYFDITTDNPTNFIDSNILQAVTVNPSGTAPEPATLGLTGLGLVAAGLIGRKRKK